MVVVVHPVDRTAIFQARATCAVVVVAEVEMFALCSLAWLALAEEAY